MLLAIHHVWWLLAVDAGGGVTPVWPYIVGGVAALVTCAAGTWRLYMGWRAGIEEEAEKKLLNTQALKDNTDAAERNSQAIAMLTRRLDQWESRWELFADKTEARLGVLERPSPRPPRRGVSPPRKD